MKIKPGVSVSGLRPEILLAVIAAEGIWQKYNGEAVITSGVEGKHKKGSAHYTGRAVDLRVKNISPSARPRAALMLRDAMGLDYDVVHEGIGKPWEHVHVEFDPKGD